MTEAAMLTLVFIKQALLDKEEWWGKTSMHWLRRSEESGAGGGYTCLIVAN